MASSRWSVDAVSGIVSRFVVAFGFAGAPSLTMTSWFTITVPSAMTSDALKCWDAARHVEGVVWRWLVGVLLQPLLLY